MVPRPHAPQIGHSYYAARMTNPRPFASALRNASIAYLPTAIKQVPCAGDVPGLPSVPMNLSFPSTNKIASALGANCCHQGADDRSGVSAMPLP